MNPALRLPLYAVIRATFLPFCLIVLGACAGRTPPSVPGASLSAAGTEAARQAYLDASDAAVASPGPFRIGVSLRVGTPEDTRRVTGRIWGNDTLPVRLDVTAGFGSVIARLRESAEAFTVHAPLEKKALVHRGSQRVLLHFGVPVPFGPADLTALALGRFAEVFGRDLEATSRTDAEGPVFATSAPDGAESALLTLRPDGLPVRWRRPKSGWEMRVTYDDAGPALPRKIELRHTDGNRAVLLIKSREIPDRPYTDRELALDLPPDTALVPLERLEHQGEKER